MVNQKGINMLVYDFYRKFGRYIERNKRYIAIWAVCLACALIALKFFSDGDFSFILVYLSYNNCIDIRKFSTTICIYCFGI